MSRYAEAPPEKHLQIITPPSPSFTQSSQVACLTLCMYWVWWCDSWPHIRHVYQWLHLGKYALVWHMEIVYNKSWFSSFQRYLLLQKPLSQFGTIFMQCLLCLARGTCLAKKEYDAEGPDELSMSPGDHITIVGFLVPCFDWFTGKKEATGEIGLVRTSLVKPSTDTYEWV